MVQGQSARRRAIIIPGRSSRRSRNLRGGTFRRPESVPDVRLLVEDDAQQGAMDLQVAIIVDEAQLPKLVYEFAHPRARGADHPGQRLLADLSDDPVGRARLAEIRQ